jgi:serine/threonine protein kinase
MIPEQDRLWAHYGQIPVGIGDAVWAVADWDSRRWITAEGPSDVFGDDEGEEICRALLPIVDDLEPNITKVTLSAAGEVRSTSTSPEDDCTPIVDYPLFTEKEVGEDSFDCVQRSRLEEIDRLYICVDLVSLKAPNNASTLMAFKYTILQGQLERLWKEAFLVKRLQSCRYVVPFHNFIINDAQPLFLGFTTSFIPGGCLLETHQPFRKDWLQQLMDFVDDLNLSYGIVHQDIAPRNLFVEPSTNNLVVIDFGLATYIGSEHEHQQRNDVNGVIYTLYEILTHDEHFRDGVQPDDYHIEDVTSMEEWPLQIDLEPGLDVQTLRLMVMKWVEIRQESNSQRDFIHIALTIPKMPSMGMGKMAIEDEDRLEAEPYNICRNVSTDERSVRWERTPQRKLRNHKKE